MSLQVLPEICLWFGAYWAIAHIGELACYQLKLSTQFHLQFKAKLLQQISNTAIEPQSPERKETVLQKDGLMSSSCCLILPVNKLLNF